MKLAKILSILHQQCQIVIADNSDSKSSASEIKKLVINYGAVYLPMEGNVGIAKAQNRAIECAWSKGGEYVLLLDDDSIPSDRIVENFHHAVGKFSEQQVILGARIVDYQGIEISNSKLGSSDYVQCRDLNSSGSFIHKRIFEEVGYFREELFIDCVDFEWGWRARRLGYDIIIISDATLQHSLGIGKSKGLRIPSPIRHYYQYRNVLYLIFDPVTPVAWKISQIFKLPIKIIAVVFLAPDALIRIKFSLLGIRDFVKKKTGKLIC